MGNAEFDFNFTDSVVGMIIWSYAQWGRKIARAYRTAR